VLGHRAEEALGKDDNALLPPERARARLEHDRQVLATERTLTFEHSDEIKGRRHVYYAIEGVLRDESGKVTGLWGISHDITAFKQAEGQLTLQTERLRLSMEAARIGTWDWDLLERKVYWSGDVAAIAGLPPEGVESSYTAFFDRVVAEDRALLAQRIAAAVQERTGFDVEFRVASAGKPPRWLRGKGWVLSDGTRAVRMLGALMDVTHEKLAQEDARRLGEFQEQLVGIVSHDIRSPLGAIISWTRMLEQGLAGSPASRARNARRTASR
jgi:PAS domain S-box-containing protein